MMRLKLFPILAVALVATLLGGCADLQRGNRKEAVYEQIITVLKPIDRVSVAVSYQGGAFYHVQVSNGMPSVISLVWDESSYVNTKGESIRLIRVLDKNNLPTNMQLPQADSPIVPKSQLVADFVGESWAKLARFGMTPKPKDDLKAGRIYLVFNINGKRVDWQGEVAFVARKPSEPSASYPY